MYIFLLQNIQLTPQELRAGRKNLTAAPQPQAPAGEWLEDQKRLYK